MTRTIYFMVWSSVVWQELHWIAEGATRWEIAIVKRLILAKAGMP